ncbi:hypothetical protein T07_702 [Trichinella nelsoni]|uniref:Uncharacterized protein n=1 Tax=Trichinella nelsoni TaxID=6336 RepID=A0A0V0RB31_9BILA|nr:hypothetical protein T07_702 [Trichinella nelsoni]
MSIYQNYCMPIKLFEKCSGRESLYSSKHFS